MTDEKAFAGNSASVGPSDLEAEQMVLGSILVDHRALQQAEDMLLPIYFANEANLLIASACLGLSKRDMIANPVTVKEELTTQGKLVAAGGAEYLIRLAALGRSRGLRGIIFKLQDLYLRRVLIAEAQRMIERVSTPEDGEKGFEALSATVARLQELRHKVAKFMGGF